MTKDDTFEFGTFEFGTHLTHFITQAEVLSALVSKVRFGDFGGEVTETALA